MCHGCVPPTSALPSTPYHTTVCCLLIASSVPSASKGSLLVGWLLSVSVTGNVYLSYLHSLSQLLAVYLSKSFQQSLSQLLVGSISAKSISVTGKVYLIKVYLSYSQSLSQGRICPDNSTCCHNENLQTKVPISPSDSILTPCQAALTLT